ncbi:bestrophin-like domain [Ruegeria meonggei]|uniref:bestrophin-like domain n=1 Tax=Ruegeria meonggei TaxID=1446476 RepID=UPI00366B6680
MNQTLLTAFFIIAGTVVMILLVYRATHWLVGREPESVTKELSGSVLGRVSALHALILGLVFAQLALDYRVLQTDLGSEADTVRQIVTDAQLHGGAGTEDIIAGAKDYIDVVVTQEWQDLASAKAVGSAGRTAWLEIYQGTLNLESDTAVQKRLHDNLVAKARALDTFRSKRLNIASGSNQVPFWFAAIAGLVIISVSYFAFAPSGLNIVFVALFGVYNGITLFLIYAFANPYVPPGALEPVALSHVRVLIGQ